MESLTDDQLVDRITTATSDAKAVESVLHRGVDNASFTQDDRNKLRVSARDLGDSIGDLDKGENEMRRLVRSHRSDQIGKLEELETRTDDAKNLFRGISRASRAASRPIPTRAMLFSVLPASLAPQSPATTSSASGVGLTAPAGRGHYSGFVRPRRGGKKRKTKKRKTKKRKSKRRKSKRRRTSRRH